MLSTQVTELANRSVLCWLATVDATGQPNVSPKEIFAVFDSEHLVIANIASPGSARNIESQALVCVSFIDIFVQKGFKVAGVARNVGAGEPDFAFWSAPLALKAMPKPSLNLTCDSACLRGQPGSNVGRTRRMSCGSEFSASC